MLGGIGGALSAQQTLTQLATEVSFETAVAPCPLRTTGVTRLDALSGRSKIEGMHPRADAQTGFAQQGPSPAS